MVLLRLSLQNSILWAKQLGYSDVQLGQLLGRLEERCDFRVENGILPTYKIVDTCWVNLKQNTITIQAMNV